MGAERRVPAPHPGPVIREEYLAPLRLTVAAVAARTGIDERFLSEILAGTRSFDVESAVRVARALQLPADKIMQMQVKHDFAVVRRTVDLQAVPVLERADIETSFPSGDFMRGRLARMRDDAAAEPAAYFQQDVEAGQRDEYLGVHALWCGDRLRIYDPADAQVLWVGPILQNLDGRMLLPYARPEEWRTWFADAYRADLAFGSEHLAFFARMHAGGS